MMRNDSLYIFLFVFFHKKRKSNVFDVFPFVFEIFLFHVLTILNGSVINLVKKKTGTGKHSGGETLRVIRLRSMISLILS